MNFFFYAASLSDSRVCCDTTKSYAVAGRTSEFRQNTPANFLISAAAIAVILKQIKVQMASYSQLCTAVYCITQMDLL